MTTRTLARWITPLVLPYLPLTGCSLLGFGIGAIIDGNAEEFLGPVTAIDFVETGSKVGITKTDSSRVMGIFQGVQTATEQAYALNYLRRVSVLDSVTYAPAYHEQVRLITANDTVVGAFRGFDRNTAWVAAADSQPARGRSLDSLEWIEEHFGRRIRGWQARDLIVAGRIPSRSAARLSIDDAVQAVPMEAIASVTVLSSPGSGGSAKWVGLGVGVALDIVWIALAIEANETANDCNPNNSCSKTYNTR
jgi:hypothetical protein